MDVDELLAYIEQNIKEDISLIDLARVVHFSPRQVYYMIIMSPQLVEGMEPNSFTSLWGCRNVEEYRTEYMRLGASLRNMMKLF